MYLSLSEILNTMIFDSPRMSKPLTVEKGLELSLILTAVGAAFLLIGLSDAMGWWFELNGWGFYLGAVGVLSLLVGVIWSISIVQRVRKFKLMMMEKSKAAFVRSLDDLEYTAWRLPSKYDVLVMKKKNEMGVK